MQKDCVGIESKMNMKEPSIQRLGCELWTDKMKTFHPVYCLKFNIGIIMSCFGIVASYLQEGLFLQTRRSHCTNKNREVYDLTYLKTIYFSYVQILIGIFLKE